jgi:hypothetical protein
LCLSLSHHSSVHPSLPPQKERVQASRFRV